MVLTLALLLAGSAPQPAFQTAAATAQGTPSGPTIHVEGSRRKWDPQRIVCKDLDQPGSRLSVKRVCRSMLEWASDRREDQQLLIQKQYNGAP
ncbi:MAG: hypothetical protein JO013_01195 [Alphaproteobacteria bacterium]|nr:hypothetical protein [Alphaproteobacteria bacterium]